MSNKRHPFDCLFFLYTFWLAAYFAAPWAFTEEYATSHMWDLFKLNCLLLFVMGAISLALTRFDCVTLGGVLFPKSPFTAPPLLRSFWGWHLLLVSGLSFVVSIQVTEFSLNELTDPAGFQGALRLYQGLTHANLALLPTAIVQVVETLYLAFLATVLAVPVAFVLCFFSAKNIMKGPGAFVIYALLRTVLNIGRAVEPLIWALIFTVWVGVGPFAGMLALLVHSVVSLAKQYSEAVEDAAVGPIEAIRSTGANSTQVVWFGIVPQVAMQFIALTLYRWDSNVRMATVIGLVGGGGIGTLLIKYQGQAMWPEVGCIIIVIAAAVWLMDAASAYIREALR